MKRPQSQFLGFKKRAAGIHHQPKGLQHTQAAALKKAGAGKLTPKFQRLRTRRGPKR